MLLDCLSLHFVFYFLLCRPHHFLSVAEQLHGGGVGCFCCSFFLLFYHILLRYGPHYLTFVDHLAHSFVASAAVLVAPTCSLGCVIILLL